MSKGTPGLAVIAVVFGAIATSQTPAESTERLRTDTPKTTVRGNAFIAPKDWSLRVRGPATIIEAPESDSAVALVDIEASGPEEALAAAWHAYKAEAKWPVKVTNDLPDKDGWSRRRAYDYLTSPNEQRGVAALVAYSGTTWTVVIRDLADSVAEKRGAQVALVMGRLLPKGYSRESFAGRKAAVLDSARIAELTRFIEQAQKATGVPGVALGVVQGGKVVFADGLGRKELGGTAKPDGDTLFMVASNTKALTTLLLAKLVDEHRLTWDTPVTKVFPTFRLGDAETTRSVQVKHLICACTGMPRQDFEWLLEYGSLTPERSMTVLGMMRPTSKFGELFQYSNLMAAAAGYAGGYVLYPKMELGAAYDRAMQSYVFDPLDMKATTFDFKRALAGNHASAHSPDVDGKPRGTHGRELRRRFRSRPAGAAWSRVRDNLKYVTDGTGARASCRTARHSSPASRSSAPRATGRDRKRRDLRHGPDGGQHIRCSRRSSRRRHDRLPQRHDLVAAARCGSGGSYERRPRMADPQSLQPEAARSTFRWHAMRPMLRLRRMRSTFLPSLLLSVNSSLFRPTRRKAPNSPGVTKTRLSVRSRLVRRGRSTVFDFGEWKIRRCQQEEPGWDYVLCHRRSGDPRPGVRCRIRPKRTLITATRSTNTPSLSASHRPVILYRIALFCLVRGVEVFWGERLILLVVWMMRCNCSGDLVHVKGPQLAL